MPIYEYRCQTCGRTLEKRQKFSDAALTECPYCGGHLEKTITAPAVQFKGGGWDADLYSSSKGGKPAASSEGAAASSGSGEGSGAADTSSSGNSSATKSGGSTESSAPSSAAPSAPANPTTNK